ncbi:MAG: glycosyltransferase [bacterium]
MELQNYPLYVFLFLSLYFEVFLLITYFEKRVDLKEENLRSKRAIRKYPTVTIMVPCWNEEKTLSKTIHSLLNLNYPKDKLKIMIIDDGSTDNTWSVAQKFAGKKQVELYHKENGGKYTALNFGLSKVTSDLVGCLDADSYVDKDALKNIVIYFEDKETMAVTPSVKVWKPKTIIQLIQKVEYGWGIFVRKLLSYIGAMYVTPGPFSIFRREVFENLGGYRHAHQTEDMELAVRMQSNHYKIVNSHNAVVYTVAPSTFWKLYKQRLRWTNGFIHNVVDYKHLFFKKEYGNLGVFILPMATLSILSAIYVLSVTVISIVTKIINEIIKIRTVGLDFHFDGFSFDWFYINTQVMAIGSLVALLGTIIIILLSRKMAEGKVRFGLDLVYFFALYALIAPIWMAKALYNSLFAVKTTWR